MAKRGIRKKEHERLDDLTIGRVVLLLGQDKPITKKAACEILNIAYSTKRLGDIITEYEEKIAYAKRRIKFNKGRDFDPLEKRDLVVAYLSGESITSISRRLFRSVNILKNEITKYNLPTRDKTTDYHNPKMMPDEMVSDSFNIKEYVWSTRYNCVSEIQDYISDLYSIWVFGKFNQFAIQPAEELGKLEILKEFKLHSDEFQTTTQTLDMSIK